MNPPVIHSLGLRFAGGYCRISSPSAARVPKPLTQTLRIAGWVVIATLLVLLDSRLCAQDAQERLLLVPWTKAPQEVPVFHSVSARLKARVGLEKVESELQLGFQIHQGQPKVLSVELVGHGEVTAVSGAGVRDWALRKAADGRRYLDIHPVGGLKEAAGKLEVVVTTLSQVVDGKLDLLLPAPAAAAGFALQLQLEPQPAVDLRVTTIEGLTTVASQETFQYVASTTSRLGVSVTPSGMGSGLEVLGSRLEGTLSKDGKSVKMVFNGVVRSERVGASVELLSGRVALAARAAGDGWRLALSEKPGKGWVHELVAEKTGEMPVSFEFLSPVIDAGDWRQVDFSMPPGVVVPVELKGFSKEMEFSPSNSVVPRNVGDRLSAFMPATGRADIAWRPSIKVADGTLFFSSDEVTEVRVGSGLMRQRSLVSLRVLQGKLQQLEFDVAGRGEILSVSGNSAVVGWQVTGQGNQRRLVVKLSRPITKQDKLLIDAQVNMEGKPLEAAAIRLSPVGTLRHSGWLRLANEGSVRLEVIGAEGLIQLAPHQFPVPQDASLRQVVVYRFPSAQYGYRVQASQVLPEVSVSEITVYELGETDLRIHSDIELDVREAPVREWLLEIPSDYAVNSVVGAQIADFSPGSEVRNGRRSLNIIFKGPVIDRHLIHLVMSKNQAPKAGEWKIQPLEFPDVKSRRGYVGAVATAGYRLEVAKSTGLAEVPLTFFPKAFPGLQQALRLREPKWSLDLRVEALGQSIQADVFHLYSLKAGAIYGSVLINYFVVGSPATEWRVEVPAGIGNIDVTGQNVGRDWRQNDSVVIIPLSRPVLGAGTVLLTFEQPMNAQGGHLDPGAVKPLGVQGERGLIQVVSPLQVDHELSPEPSGSILAIDPTEIPTEFRLLSTSPTLGAWQYTSRDFKLGMNIKWFDPGETMTQVVDYQKLATHLSRDGQWVTDAQVFVKSRGSSVLRMRLPREAVLWEVKVAGQATNARVDGEHILVPLPPESDPGEALEILLRFGARSGGGSGVELVAPRFDVPVVIGEWTIEGDQGRKLLHKGGTASLIEPVADEDGWQWVARHQVHCAILLLMGALSVLLGGRVAKWSRILALLLGLASIALSLGYIGFATLTSEEGSDVLRYTAPVVQAGEAVTVRIANLAPWVAQCGWDVWLLLLAGLGVCVRGFMAKDRWWKGCGVMLMVAGLFSIGGGAKLVFLATALLLAVWWMRLLLQVLPTLRRVRPTPPPPPVVALLALLLALGFAPGLRAEPVTLSTAESMVHDWKIQEGRLHGSLQVSVVAKQGQRFLLLGHPAVMQRVDAEGLKVVKGPHGQSTAYWLVAERDGRLNANVEFEMPVDPVRGWKLPTGPAAYQSARVSWNQAGWEFISPAAVCSQLPHDAKQALSEANLVFAPMADVTILARAMSRDVINEQTRYVAEVANLYVPGPGVVDGRHLVTIRPSQGQVTKLVMRVPADFTVSDVTHGPVGNWRFDPQSRELQVSVLPAQTSNFQLIVETQRSAGDLPMDLVLEPLRVVDPVNEIGLLGVALGDEVVSEGLVPTGLAKVNPEDFNAALLPSDAKGKATAVLLHAYRYGAAKASLGLRINPVAPELRAQVRQLVSLGDDRLLITCDLEVMITRSGVFRLLLEAPESLEIESATGEGLSHWTVGDQDGRRILTLHLAGKTMGQQNFSLTLVGRPVEESEEWAVPKLRLLEASRETGVLTIVPERGLRVRAVKRHNLSQIDPRDLAGEQKKIASAAVRPDAISYRLLQGDWSLGLNIRRLEPWVTARVLHDATIREGQVLTRLNIAYKIDNAAVKTRRVRIPGLDEKSAATLRATGAAFADLMAVDGSRELYELRFRRAVAGQTDVTLEYQRPSSEDGQEKIVPIELPDVRQTSYVACLRAGGRLELEAGALPRGWQRADWSALQGILGDQAGGQPPHMTFKVAEPEGPLPVVMKRHELAGLRKIRVTDGTLTSLLTPDGNVLTAVSMNMNVIDKSTLRLALPDDAQLFNVYVNDEGAPLVRSGKDWLFYVFPSPDSSRQTNLRFVYASRTRGGRLLGPVLDVPMQNLTWRMLLPDGLSLDKYSGDFDLSGTDYTGGFDIQGYKELVNNQNEMQSQSVVQQLDRANKWLSEGDQEKAGQALRSVLNNGRLDAASCEDARVQLRQLKTQQAVLGLNSRRQKLMLDNRAAIQQGGAVNDQIDQAAAANPVLQGNYNYDPQQFERFIAGNTTDENAALKAIANQIVEQQLAAEPAPAAIEITLPEKGTIYIFSRSVQVDSERPMTMQIKVSRSTESASVSWLAMLLCLAAGAMTFVVRKS